MPIEINGIRLFSPMETAQKLGTNTNMLRYYRQQGYIQGTNIGVATYYTLEQIESADISPRQRGPKKRIDGDATLNGREALAYLAKKWDIVVMNHPSFPIDADATLKAWGANPAIYRGKDPYWSKDALDALKKPEKKKRKRGKEKQQPGDNDVSSLAIVLSIA